MEGKRELSQREFILMLEDKSSWKENIVIQDDLFKDAFLKVLYPESKPKIRDVRSVALISNIKIDSLVVDNIFFERYDVVFLPSCEINRLAIVGLVVDLSIECNVEVLVIETHSPDGDVSVYGLINHLHMDMSEVNQVMLMSDIQNFSTGNYAKVKKLELHGNVSEVSLAGNIDNVYGESLESNKFMISASIKNIDLEFSGNKKVDIRIEGKIEYVIISGEINRIDVYGSLGRFENHANSLEIEVRKESKINSWYNYGLIDQFVFGGVAQKVRLKSDVRLLELISSASIDDVRISSSRIKELIKERSATIFLISISFSEIDKFWFEGRANFLYLDGVHVTDFIDLKYAKIDYFYLGGRNRLVKYFQIEFSKIFSLKFGESPLSGGSIFQIRSCEVGEIIFDRFVNLAIIYFSSIQPLMKGSWSDVEFTDEAERYYASKKYKPVEPSNIIKFLNSDVGTVHFQGAGFEKFKGVKFMDSKISNITLDGYALPKLYPMEANEESSGTREVLTAHYKSNRVYYSQLKIIHENSGNKSEYLSALQDELRNYHLELRSQIGLNRNYWLNTRKYSFWTQTIWNTKNRGERFMLWVSYFSSRFETNWLRSAGVTVAFSLMSFMVYALLLGYEICWLDSCNWQKTSELASHAISFLNPLRNEDSGQLFQMIKLDIERGVLDRDYVDGKPRVIIPSSARVVDYMARIIVAILVYETVQSFRKLRKGRG